MLGLWTSWTFMLCFSIKFSSCHLRQYHGPEHILSRSCLTWLLHFLVAKSPCWIATFSILFTPRKAKHPQKSQNIPKPYLRPRLVGDFNPSEKYMKANWDDKIPNLWKNKRHVPVTTNQKRIRSGPVSIGLSSDQRLFKVRSLMPSTPKTTAFNSAWVGGPQGELPLNYMVYHGKSHWNGWFSEFSGASRLIPYHPDFNRLILYLIWRCFVHGTPISGNLQIDPIPSTNTVALKDLL